MLTRYTRIATLALTVLALAAAPAAAVVLNYEAQLDGLQEVGPNASPATGAAVITIDTDANTLTYSLSFSGLTGSQSAAHIHGFAPVGVNAGVLHSIGVGSPINGVWNYIEGDEANILAGLTYINVHTSTFPGGEIRGQIVESEAVPTEAATWGGIKKLFR